MTEVGRAGRRRLVLALSLLTLAAALFLAATRDDREFGFHSDDGVYLLLAEAYRLPASARLPVHDEVIRVTHFPPGWPMLLAVFGADPDHPQRGALANVLCLLLALLAIARWVQLDGGRWRAGLLAAGLVAALPATLIYLQLVYSEFAFMACLYAVFALLAAARAAEPATARRLWLLAAVLVAMASLIRSMGVVLVIAFAVALLWQSRPQRGWLLAVAALPYLVWTVAHAVLADRLGYVSDGARGLRLLIDGGPAMTLRLVREMMQHLVTAFSDARPAQGGRFGPAAVAVAAVCLLALPEWWRRFRLGRCDAWYLAGSFALILIWPYTGPYFVPRFLYPQLPILIGYALLSVAACQRAAVRALPAALIAAVALSGSLSLWLRALSPVPEELRGYVRSPSYLRAPDAESAAALARFHRDLSRALREFAADVPPGECVHAPQSALVMAHMRRIARTMPSPARIDAVLAGSGSLQAIGGCRWILAINSDTAEVPAMYPAERLSRSSRYLVRPYRVQWPGRETVVAALFRER